MKQVIKETTSFASGILSQLPEGSVHSVYRKTVNLKLGPSLLALQADGSPLSPVSLITGLDAKEMAALSIQPQDKVSTNGTTITVFSKGTVITFDLGKATVYDSFLPDHAVPLSPALIRKALFLSSSGGLSELFSGTAPDASSDFAKEAFLSVARRRMEDARKAVLTAHYDEAASFLAGMTGLGMGLTPSGDDFLCGVLAGLLLSGQWEHPFARTLRRTLVSHLGDTNDISRTFLSCALACHFSRPVKELPHASGALEILASFGAIGHSSGMDTLCGISFILQLFHTHP